MLNIVVNIREDLFSQAKIEKILKGSFIFLQLKDINELQNYSKLPNGVKRLVLHSIEELQNLDLLSLLKILKGLQYKEIFELSTLNVLSIEALLKAISYVKRYKPNLGRKGRPSKVLSLSTLQKELIIKWIQGEISLEECKNKTNLSQSTLYIIRKEKFQDYVVPGKKNSTLLAEVIREYHMRKIPLLKALRITNISRPYFYKLASSFLEKQTLIKYTSEDISELESLKGVESLEKVTPETLKQNSKIIKFDFDNFIYRIYHVSALNIKSFLIDGQKVKFSTFFSSNNSNYYLYDSEVNIHNIFKKYIYDLFALVDSNFNFKDITNIQLLSILSFIETEVKDRQEFVDSLLKYYLLKNKDRCDTKSINKASIAIVEFFNSALVK